MNSEPLRSSYPWLWPISRPCGDFGCPLHIQFGLYTPTYSISKSAGHPRHLNRLAQKTVYCTRMGYAHHHQSNSIHAYLTIWSISGTTCKHWEWKPFPQVSMLEACLSKQGLINVFNSKIQVSSWRHSFKHQVFHI